MDIRVISLMGRLTLEQLAQKAVDFIVETQEQNDYICEQMGEWCEKHCIDSLREECVKEYLMTKYKKE